MIAIVLGEGNATTRNSETMELLDYGYQNLKVNKLKSANDVLKKIKLDKADSEIVEIILKNDLYVTENIGDNNREYDFSINIDELKLPVKKGDRVGEIVVYYKNKKVKTGELTVSKDIKSLSFIQLYLNELFDLISGEFL